MYLDSYIIYTSFGFLIYLISKFLFLYKENKKNHITAATLRKENLNNLNVIYEYKEDLDKHKKALEEHKKSLEKILTTNVEAFPYLAGMISDYLTYDFEVIAKQLEWGKSIERKKKVASIREIRSEAKNRIQESKIALYQLEYIKKLYPSIEDLLEENYKDVIHLNNLTEMEEDYDPIRRYISKEEWKNLPDIEKNQLALENYIKSRKKSNWQIGRDYELYVGYTLEKKGYTVEYYGSLKGLEDMGRDLIVKNKANNKVQLVQCKYWSKRKTIHEKHIFQLFGTLISYGLENNIDKSNLKGVFFTNTDFSPNAVKVAKLLDITLIPSFSIDEFPRIKSNIGKENKIYHLPMDQQYDKVKIEKPGEFYAFNVYEAELQGFRRAFRFRGLNNTN